jgi:hypothetical protein
MVLGGPVTLTPQINPGKWFNTEMVLLLTVNPPGANNDYRLLFGPHPDGSGPARAMINQDAAGNWQVTVRDNGFVYMTGVQPHGGTDGASTTSDGSILLVERTEDALGQSVHRFYYLDKGASGKMTVTNKVDPANKRDLQEANKYVEKIGFGDLSPIKAIVPGSDEDDFVQAVIAIAEANGLDTP